MTHRHYIIGTAGHIDHGKSTLVEALTGVDPDRLPEEQSRGMTIDLGFAHLDVPDPQDPETLFSLGVVDVPGHADFVKNMVAGVGSIDLVLIVVAVDDRWMPQTEEHVQIVQYLGVKRAVVALTKTDLVEDPSPAIDQTRAALDGTVFAEAPIVPVCALGGDGLEALRQTIAETLREAPPVADYGKPRLHVDRAFSPKGVGTVVTGTLSGGNLQRGAAAVIQPTGEKTTARNLQSHNANVETAYPGMRTAVNLTDVGVAKQERKRVNRGDVITLPDLGSPGTFLDVSIERLKREIPGQPASKKPIKNGQRVRWHHGGASHSARVFFYSTKQLLPGEKALAQLRFEQPVYAFLGDHFVIRDWPKTSSLAGGVVLDTAPPSNAFRSPDQADFLKARAVAPTNLQVAASSLLRRDHALPSGDFLHQAPFAGTAITETVAALAESGEVDRAGQWLVDRSWWAELLESAASQIKEHHRLHLDQSGMPLANLRAHFETRLPDAGLVDALIETLGALAFQRIGKAMRHQDHRPTLPPELQRAGERLLTILRKVPLEPPNPKELAPGADERQALRFLIEMGEVVDLGEKCVLAAEAYEKARTTVIDYLKQNQRATVSELRQEIGTTRRVLMPILDRLDKQGVTVRLDDVRVLSRTFLRKQGESASS